VNAEAAGRRRDENSWIGCRDRHDRGDARRLLVRPGSRAPPHCQGRRDGLLDPVQEACCQADLRYWVPAGQADERAPDAAALRVGALFFRNGAGDHYCTAIVVASPGRDLLITAAHCINAGKGGGNRQGIVFIPDYQDGQAPFGIWSPARLVVAPQWLSSADPNLDVGFVILKPHDGRTSSRCSALMR
jgi:hypothetical protein